MSKPDPNHFAHPSDYARAQLAWLAQQAEPRRKPADRGKTQEPVR